MSHIDFKEVQSQHLKNLFHSGLLLGSMALLLGVIGFLMFGWTGVVWGLAFWTMTFFFAPQLSSQLILRWMGAYPIRRWQAPTLFQIVEELSKRAELPVIPTIVVVPQMQPNAFAMGRREAPILGLTQGLLQRLSPRELQGVLAHEMSHIRNGDLWVMELAGNIARLTSILSMVGLLGLFFTWPLFLAQGQPFPLLLLLLLLFAPRFTSLMQLALSRTREFEADRQSILLTGDPNGLVRALKQLDDDRKPLWQRIFLPQQQIRIPHYLRSHPSTQERVERLQSYYQNQTIQLPPRTIFFHV